MISSLRKFIQSHRETIIRAMHIFALVSIAVARPLFDILGNNATFFVANRLRTPEIVNLVLMLSFAIPLAIVTITVLFRLISVRAGSVVQYFFVSLLFLLSILPFAKRIQILGSAFQVALAIICALVGIVLYIRLEPVKMFVSALSPAIIVVPAIFIFFTPVSKILFPPSLKSMEGRNIHANIPIVMVVFDEFGLVSLMDGSRNIDSVRYPNFYALSKTSNWYRNATSVCDVTERAIPAILTGQLPELVNSIVPNRGNYPENLLTLLHQSYNVKVLESVTEMSADPTTESIISSSILRKDFTSVFQDVRSIYLRFALPEGIGGQLPQIQNSWGGFFWEADTSKKTFTDEELWKLPGHFRKEKFRLFINSMENNPKPPLYFQHLLLPHIPYEYLPSGKRYRLFPFESPEYMLKDEFWGNIDPNVLTEVQQRYLLQVGFVDNMIGELVNHLKSVGLFDRCILIVTADHGVSFKRDDFRRPLTGKNYMDILPIPLFIKFPQQSTGEISDANVESIDILPTIASTLKIEIPWKIDGISVLDTAILRRTKKQAVNIHQQDIEHKVNEYPASILANENSLDSQIAVYGSGTSGGNLYKVGPFRDWIGRPLKDFSTKWSRGFYPVIDHQKYYEALSLDEERLITEVTGKVQFISGVSSNMLAVILNDTIRAVKEIEDSTIGSYSALLPDFALRKGYNKLEVDIVRNPNSSHPIFMRPLLLGEYSLVYTKWGEETLENPQHERIPLIAESRGFLDTVFANSIGLFGAGWTADVATGEVPFLYAVFVDGNFHYAGIPGETERPDLAISFNNVKLKDAGFSFSFIAQQVTKATDPKIRIFAVFQNYASELINKTLTKSGPQLNGNRILKFVSGDSGKNFLRFLKNIGYLPIEVRDGLTGTIDELGVKNNTITIAGWAADVANNEPADKIVMMLNDSSLTIFPTGVSRPDLVKAFKKKGVEKAGFFVTLQKELTGAILTTDRIRFFAISRNGDVATELSYPVNPPLKH